METEYLYETPLNTHKQCIFYNSKNFIIKIINIANLSSTPPTIMLYTHLIHDYKKMTLTLPLLGLKVFVFDNIFV